ncbi:hypothetical protein Hanom_Chr15g01381231 [Helianthus anomalus]
MRACLRFTSRELLGVINLCFSFTFFFRFWLLLACYPPPTLVGRLYAPHPATWGA